MNRLWLLACVLLLSMPAVAQDNGHGVIIFLDESRAPVSGFEALHIDTEGNTSRIFSFMYPLLFADHPLRGTAGTSAYGDGLAVDPPALPETTQTYTLRDNLAWSDGAPITAYDVAYSLLGRGPLLDDPASPLAGLRVDDEQRFTLALPETDCTTHARVNSVILPSHYYNRDFRPFAESFAPESGAVPSLRDWHEAFTRQYPQTRWFSLPDDGTLLSTGDRFVLVTDSRRAYLQRGDLVVRNAGSSDKPAIEQFLHGSVNLLLDPPFERRADLRATPGIQLYEAPGYEVDYLVFNQSDPNYPRDAFVDGAPLEQLPHPYFSDMRVRRALQLAIDVPALIDGALYGSATPLNGAYSPASWAYDPDLPPLDYDPAQAERLLDEAGWRDINGDGYRECFGCLHARPGMTLSINLHVSYDGVRERTVRILRAQLARVGVDLHLGSDGDGRNQDFDLLLTGTNARDPDLYRLFAREWDRYGLRSGNIGSVDHAELETILDTARRVPGCGIGERAALYREAQRLLRADVPAMWLYARHDLYAARGIGGFAPMAGDPFWNISEWMVAR